jgi:hypothetical protein
MMNPDIARALTRQHGRDLLAQASQAQRAKRARTERDREGLGVVIPAIPDTVAELFGDQPQRPAPTR